MRDHENKLENAIRALIESYVNGSEENALGGSYADKAWGSPLIGFSRGDDPLYMKYKKDIGDFYWTPLEIFQRSFPGENIQPEELSVIVWVLPQTEFTKADMKKEKLVPSERAARARREGEAFNQKVGAYLVQELGALGIPAIAPSASLLWENHQSVDYGFASSWSERHAAYISGLGTFSLTDTLITEVGTAVRLGSVVARASLVPTDRMYRGYQEFCLHSQGKGCGKCIGRCPAKAITEKGHDKMKCREYQRTVTGEHLRNNYGIVSRYCGLCQFDIPCESKIPGRKIEEDHHECI